MIGTSESEPADNEDAGPPPAPEDGGEGDGGAVVDGGRHLDGGLHADGGVRVDGGARDAGPPPPVDGGSDSNAGVAPADGSPVAQSGANPVTLAAGRDVVFRVEAKPGEHVGLMLTFSPTGAAAVLQVDRWNGHAPGELARTDGGVGRRALAVYEPSAARTYWVRVRSPVVLSGNLQVTRTSFQDAIACPADCDRLLQLPLPIDPRIDGYTSDAGTVFRYQFGRRDLVMFIRHAGQVVAAAGMTPIIPYDFSQWDSLTPGTDVGALRHVSHQRGKDIDVSLYGSDGVSVWRSYCTAHTSSAGRECVAGTMQGLDGYATARMLAAVFASHRVTMCFLDRELIGPVRTGAASASHDGLFDPSLLPLFSDGTHLQHWPNHDNHVHIRVSEAPTNGHASTWEIFEAP